MMAKFLMDLRNEENLWGVQFGTNSKRILNLMFSIIFHKVYL